MRKNITKESCKLSRRKALIELFTYSKKLKDEYWQKYKKNLEINLDKNFVVSDSKCNTEDPNSPVITIGIYELIHPEYKVDEKFVKSVVALMHEYRHADGITSKYHHIRDNNQDNMYLLINHLACDTNASYCKNESNYKFSPCEIDAEKYAVMRAKEFIMSIFTEQESDELIIKYVNEQSKYDESYKIPPTPKGYNSIYEIKNAFDEAFENSKCHERKLDLSSWDEYALLLSNYNWIDMRNKLYLIASSGHNASEEIGYDTDKAIVSLMIYLHPEYQSYIDKIQHVDLSPKKIFGISGFPLRDDELDIDNEK